MSAFSQRRYIVTGDGITVHAQSLDEAIAAFRARAQCDHDQAYDSIGIEEPVKTTDDGRLPAA